jgi:hypothetical protein
VASPRLLIRLVLQIISNQIRDAPRDGLADFFSHVGETAESASQDREAFRHLPMNSHIQRDCGDGAGNIHRQMFADFLIGDFADFLQQLTVAAVNFGFLSHFEQPVSPRVSASVDAVADTGNELFIRLHSHHGPERDVLEMGFL